MRPVIISRDEYLALRARIQSDYRILSNVIRENKRQRSSKELPEIVRRLCQSNVPQLARAAKAAMDRLQFLKESARLSVNTARAMEASAS